MMAIGRNLIPRRALSGGLSGCRSAGGVSDGGELQGSFNY